MDTTKSVVVLEELSVKDEVLVDSTTELDVSVAVNGQ